MFVGGGNGAGDEAVDGQEAGPSSGVGSVRVGGGSELRRRRRRSRRDGGSGSRAGRPDGKNCYICCAFDKEDLWYIEVFMPRASRGWSVGTGDATRYGR